MADFAHDSSGAVKRGKQFEEVALRNVDYNRFDLSFDNRITFNSGLLYPIVCKRALPGDVFHCSISALVRAAPLAAPAYQKYDVYVHGFYIPDRLLWSHFKEFRSPGDGKVSMAEMLSYTPPALPRVKISDFFTTAELNKLDTIAKVNADKYCKLWDCFNLPSPLAYVASTNANTELIGSPTISVETAALTDESEVCSLPFRAYYLIWYEYFRDQNVYTSPELNIAQDGVETDNLDLFCLMPRAWEKDYFTSCLPSAQRGAPVTIGLGDTANVYLQGGLGIQAQMSSPIFVRQKAGSSTDFQDDILTNYGTTQPNSPGYPLAQFDNAANNQSDGVSGDIVKIKGNLFVPQDTLIGYADISAASAVTIESLRVAARTQEWLEKQARCGSRYNEFLLAHWGVVSSDARLQRPVYIGGGKASVAISDVMNQTATDPGSYVGKAISSDNDLGFGEFFCEEDGYIICLLSLLPRTSYSQGIPRDFKLFDPLEWVSPEFANLGEQVVKSDEIFHYFNDESSNEEVLGFQARFQEAKYSFDEIHGEFRGSLNHWTESRLFDDAPSLSYDFISCNPSNRVFNVTDNSLADHWYADIWINLLVDRKLPEFSIPQL